MHWPQIIYLALMFLGLGISAANNEKQRTPESFGFTLLNKIWMLALLYWGGFFDVFSR